MVFTSIFSFIYKAVEGTSRFHTTPNNSAEVIEATRIPSYFIEQQVITFEIVLDYTSSSSVFVLVVSDLQIGLPTYALFQSSDTGRDYLLLLLCPTLFPAYLIVCPIVLRNSFQLCSLFIDP